LAAPSAGAKVACTLEREREREREREKTKKKKTKEEGRGRRCRGSRGLLAALDGFILHFHGGTMGARLPPRRCRGSVRLRSLGRIFRKRRYLRMATRSTRSAGGDYCQLISGQLAKGFAIPPTRRGCKRRLTEKSTIDTRNYGIISPEGDVIGDNRSPGRSVSIGSMCIGTR